MKKFMQEFKEFAMRGNVVDMAVGVIIATAFGKITTTLVNNVFMPFVGWLFGGIDLSQLDIVLKAAVMDGETVVSEAVVIGIGAFLSAIIDFILIALVVFILLKLINRKNRKKAEAEAAAAAAAAAEEEAAPTAEQLLAEIRDLLKKD